MLTTIGRYIDSWEAHILRARLEADGVPASVAYDQHIIAYWPLSQALGGAALQVPTSFAAQAQEILEAYDAGRFEQDLIAELPDAKEHCSRCGSDDIHGFIPLGQRALVVAAYLLARAPFPAKASRTRCRACGHCWRWGH